MSNYASSKSELALRGTFFIWCTRALNPMFLVTQYLYLISDTDATAILISGDKNLRLKTDVTGFEAYDVTEARDMIANKQGM